MELGKIKTLLENAYSCSKNKISKSAIKALYIIDIYLFAHMRVHVGKAIPTPTLMLTSVFIQS